MYHSDNNIPIWPIRLLFVKMLNYGYIYLISLASDSRTTRDVLNLSVIFHGAIKQCSNFLNGNLDFQCHTPLLGYVDLMRKADLEYDTNYVGTINFTTPTVPFSLANGKQGNCFPHDDVIKWKHFPRYLPFVRGIHRSRWIPHTKASDAELWCFLWSAPE